MAYDDGPSTGGQPESPGLVRSAEARGRNRRWAALPGTARELDRLVALAGGLARPPEVRVRRGRDAGTGEILRELPRARRAHLATHGFFASPRSEPRRHLLGDGLFDFGDFGERRGVGARNPLVQSGLVLAGANVLPTTGLHDDGGILTAEAVAGLDLSRLELAVLSACDTGLGEAVKGEGVFGLQRAFHLAGCKNVVASLWKLDDDATAALMALFYRNLWVEKMSPLEALRQAQLTIYRSPDAIPKLAKRRGVDFAERDLPEVTAKPVKGKRAHASLWAAFVLSGTGR